MQPKLKFKQKSAAANHKYNNGNAGISYPKIFYTATGSMMMMLTFFMNGAVVSVNATAMLATWDNAAAVSDAATMAKTPLHHNASGNPIIAQQSPKTLPAQIPATSLFPMTATKQASTSSSKFSNDYSYTDILWENTMDALPIDSQVHSASSSSSSSSNMGTCKSLTDAWGDVDPNIFYLCDMQTKQPLTIRCPPGKGYFNGLGYSGCLPFDQWPACVTTSMVRDEQVLTCDSDHMQQPWATVDPNKFYICLQEATEPMLLNCGLGKGFVHAVVPTPEGRGTGASGGASEIVGCANWEKWRSYMKCTDYY